MERGGYTVEEIARRAELDPGAVRLILSGEHRRLDTRTCVVLAGAAGGTFGDLITGIAWIPYGDRPGGRWKVDSID